ncbi:Copper metallochaperone, bacterial analog of Cox17 protein [uncultured Candidatus Thioglobus sp.]|nr:Copper metallochaperone, bacterial analog of Cox17 protein [uncultured Candidatus Thioglobus sp.]SMN01338.1 Copper metallochaperone, bacterial analog of Cox17 protein [uncultured Candidatus Thioglobus sp.]
MKKYLTIFWTALLVSFNANANIIVMDAWIRSAPPNTPVLGLFMHIGNHTDNEVKLLSASANNYKRVELHRTIEQDGMMKMHQQTFMPIPAQGMLQLEPGSWHIMMIKPNRVPNIGESVMVTLKFDNGTMQNIRAVVRKSKITAH